MEAELDPRLKALPFKIRSVSRESQSQKAANVQDSDLRTHWSTGTNTKEWLLLELEESCLLSHIRIHNKSVLEWEISVGLRFKPDTFLKVRPRCEAPRRDIMYHIGYTPCRYVRISCLRGSPIAIFFIQLIGIAVPGLEPEFQPVVDYLVTQIISRKQDNYDIYLQLLQDITSRLSPLLHHLENELNASSESIESSIRFCAMLVGPFYPIICVIGAREIEKVAPVAQDPDFSKFSQAQVFSVSSNFQAPPRRVRSPGLMQQPSGHALAFRPDSVLLLLRTAYKDNSLGAICRKVARIIRKIMGQLSTADSNIKANDSLPTSAEITQATLGLESLTVSIDPKKYFMDVADYSTIFGDDFREPNEDTLEVNYAGALELVLVEEGLLHVLYACASQPVVCRKLADEKSDLSQALPFIQAVLPALRPPSSTSTTFDQLDDIFSQWQAPVIQRVLSQVVALSTSATYRPLLDACAGYLTSYSMAHKKAACILIDLCAGPLAPWLPMVVAKVDLAIELIQDLLSVLQSAREATLRARSALIYLILALSGHMDSTLVQYKEAKHSILFIIEILEPLLTPALTPVGSTITFGEMSAVISENQDQTCALALKILHTAAKKLDILPAMEVEWRQGQAASSVLLSILAPELPLPAGLDLRRSSAELSSTELPKVAVDEFANGVQRVEASSMVEVNEDGSGLFLPSELRLMCLLAVASDFESAPTEEIQGKYPSKEEGKPGNIKEKPVVLNKATVDEYFNLQADYLQLVNVPDREIKASEFVRFATELHRQVGDKIEAHHASIDALLLAAECHLNPFFMISTNDYNRMLNRLCSSEVRFARGSTQEESWLKMIASLEEGRDKAALRILLQAAEWDRDLYSSGHIRQGGNETFADNPEGLFSGEEDRAQEDVVTLVRSHQDLLFGFLIRQLQSDKHNLYEVLLQGLLFLLNSSTRFTVDPQAIVGIILDCAERLNALIVAYQRQKESSFEPPNSVTVFGIKRQWALVSRLVMTATGGGPFNEARNLCTQGGFLQRDLVPAWAWLDNVTAFSSSCYPLVRYVGWMALSEIAKVYEATGLLFVSDVHHLTSLLLIFSDELTCVQRLKTWKHQEELQSGMVVDRVTLDSSELFDKGGLVKALYPELDELFPGLRSHFTQFAEIMLDVISLHLRAVSPIAIADLLTWFSELCRNPFAAFEEGAHGKKEILVKGFAVENVRFVVIHLLEIIVLHHMEAIIPELPKVIDILVSLCCSSFCDVMLLNSVLSVLKPIVSHAAATATTNCYSSEELVSSISFEGLCFDAMMEILRCGPVGDLESSGGPLLLFLAGSLLSDLSKLRRTELMSSFLKWANFTNNNLKNLYYNYLCAFQRILEASCSLLEGNLEEIDLSTFRGISSCTLETSNSPTMPTKSFSPHSTPKNSSIMSADIRSCAEVMDPETESLLILKPCEKESSGANEDGDDTLIPSAVASETNQDELQEDNDNVSEHADQDPTDVSNSNDLFLEFMSCLEALLMSLGQSLERSFPVHTQLTLTVNEIRSRCILLLRYNHAKHEIGQNQHALKDKKAELLLDPEEERTLVMWHLSLNDLVCSIISSQRINCWQIAAATMDFIFSLPKTFSIHKIVRKICSVLHYQSYHALQLRWRLYSCKWLAEVIARLGPVFLKPVSNSLDSLLCSMLEHPEPEQQSTALKQLDILLNFFSDAKDSEPMKVSDASYESSKTISMDVFGQDTFESKLVSATWEKVASLATGGSLIGIQRQAMELLHEYIPFAQPDQVITLLSSIDAIFPGSMTLPYTMKSGPLLRLSLGIFARACLHCAAPDLSMVPHKVWSNVKFMANSKPGSIFVETERAVCMALLQLHEHGFEEKQSLREALSSVSEKKGPDPSLDPVRETVMEVLGRLNAVRTKTDAYLLATTEEAKALEEAEIELEIMKEEKLLQAKAIKEDEQVGPLFFGEALSIRDRLKKVREQIHAEDIATKRAEIVARRERQRMVQRERQIMLEEANLKQIELLQDLDRERVAEVEQEIERRRILEKERTKTRELRHALELDNERRAQREYQRELEQRESGAVRPSRREFPSTIPSSRPRERYRERERERDSGRHQEGISQMHFVGSQENGCSPSFSAPSISSPAPIVISLALPSTPVANPVSRKTLYPGQNLSFPPTQEHNEEKAFEDHIGQGIPREPSDNSSYVEMETEFGVEAASSSNLVGNRQGSRTLRPRQSVERRERESRREGKWERKQI